MRLVRRLDVDLWIVNAALPDMSGFDLAHLLRRSQRGARVFLIDNEYQIENELRALSLGLSKYLCKPLDPAWICGWALPRFASAPWSAAACAAEAGVVPPTIPLAGSLVGVRERETGSAGPARSPGHPPLYSAAQPAPGSLKRTKRKRRRPRRRPPPNRRIFRQPVHVQFPPFC